jgi:hypothetical protein
MYRDRLAEPGESKLGACMWARCWTSTRRLGTRFGVEPICTVLCELGVTVAPSTNHARLQQRSTDAELTEAHPPGQRVG